MPDTTENTVPYTASPRPTCPNVRTREQTLSDRVDRIYITRGDCVFLNTLISLVNKTHGKPGFEIEHNVIGWLLYTAKEHPGAITLHHTSSALFEKHWVKFSKAQYEKEKKYLLKHYPELFDEKGNLIPEIQQNPQPETVQETASESEPKQPAEEQDGNELSAEH